MKGPLTATGIWGFDGIPFSRLRLIPTMSRFPTPDAGPDGGSLGNAQQQIAGLVSNAPQPLTFALDGSMPLFSQPQPQMMFQHQQQQPLFVDSSSMRGLTFGEGSFLLEGGPRPRSGASATSQLEDDLRESGGRSGGDRSASAYASRHQAAEQRRRSRINER